MEVRSGRPAPQVNSTQVVFAIILAAGLTLAINFSTRISAGRPLQEAHTRIVAEIALLREDQARLIAERDRARSDAYVERWARDEGRMVRAGERLVIPVPTGSTLREASTRVSQVEAASFADVETLPRRPANWTLWWALFLDHPAPDFSGRPAG